MTSVRPAIAVSVGAIIGATARWGITESLDSGGNWPWATFIVNVAGAFLLGVVLATTHLRTNDNSADPIRLALGTGFCGALTTFSTFAVEIASFLRGERVALGIAYLGVSMLVGVLAFAAGRRIA